MSGIDGKRILITGGTTGIGRATAILLAKAGGRLFVFGRHQKELRDALDDIQEAGEAEGAIADQADHAQITAIFEQAMDRLGGLDVVVANAALGADEIEKMKDAEWRYVADVNFTGYLDVARQAVLAFGDRGGDIILVGSVSGAEPSEGESVYAATKAGIAGFATALRKEVASRNIRVSLIEPGSVDTDMQEGSREEKEKKIRKAEMLRADDIAELVEFILTRPKRCTISDVRIEPRIGG